MDSPARFLLTIGGILLAGLLTSTLGRRSFLPRVTLLLIFGVVIGREMLDLISPVYFEHFEIITDMALLMVGFLIGGKLTSDYLKSSSGVILWISISAAVVTAVIVCLGLWCIGVAKEVAILLGCISAATAPAAVFDVVNESEQQGKFSRLLLSIVALDDIWALVLFGFGVALVTSLNGQGIDTFSLIMVVKEIGGAVLLGLLVGLPAAALTGRIKPGQPILTEALGIVFVCGGLAIWLDISFLIASVVMGAVIANLAKHHEYPFHAIEGVEWPFLVVFFVIAGASLEFNAIHDIGRIGLVYILCRAAGKLLGARIGGQCSHADPATKNWMGTALLPQAGVAIGMALMASSRFPEYRQLLLSVVIGSTIFFEIIGPVFTQVALRRTTSS